MVHVTADMMVSLDGYASGVDATQSLERPFGDCDFEALARWRFEDAASNAEEVEAIVGADAYVMGRHMFGPGRGEHDLEWTGWWGDEPPYRAPVFVLSHHDRDPLVLQGGTTFTFVTGGMRDAFDRAVAAAGESAKDGGRVAIAGGATTLNQFLAAGLVDELRLHVVPVLFGAGQRLFEGVPPTRLEQVSSRSTAHVTHLTYRVLR
ncbi:dihydrofolate reductase family protein [Aeromicrobium sp.]|uniref:dihydrofolate reductase family protein n=1 Tax=Aeromicrobium sp. TaxID=1871063 RepID=UPI0025B7BB30|nr:dihydrofolate reductase family protein [Aeromicrobium sp.]MCK5890840.1 dihydrofolate reductase family protein [Aeromicrobium sp.]